MEQKGRDRKEGGTRRLKEGYQLLLSLDLHLRLVNICSAEKSSRKGVRDGTHDMRRLCLVCYAVQMQRLLPFVWGSHLT